MNKVSDDIKEKMDQFNILDQEEIKQYKQELEKYIEEEVGSLLKS